MSSIIMNVYKGPSKLITIQKNKKKVNEINLLEVT